MIANIQKLRLLVVDDHPLMRRALQTAVSIESDIEVIGSAADGQQAQQLIKQTNPDIVLLDLLMPYGGTGLIAILRKAYPSLKILVVTSVSEGDTVLRTVQAGANGYITKEADHEALLVAIRTIGAGNSYLPPDMAVQLMDSIQNAAQMKEDGGKTAVFLTVREQELFDLLGEGLTNNQIAEKLTISPATVRVHLHNITHKYKFTSRAQAAAYAIRLNLDNK